MKFINVKYNQFINSIKGRKIIIFGATSAWKYFESLYPNIKEEIVSNVYAVVDNDQSKQNTLFDMGTKKISIFSPNILKGLDNIVILIMVSLAYHEEICNQLINLNLNDETECYSLFLMTSYHDEIDNSDVEKYFKDKNEKKIPAKIHCFWFSGDEKPDLYKRCLESWYIHCSNFEIIEWNANNYDVTKNRYMLEAFERKKWAFVSDYARLDVLKKEGGVYMDMDVELLKCPQELFCHKSIFSFNMSDHIDLAMFASVSNNPILEELMKLYEGKVFNSDGKTMNSFSQPGFVEEYFTRAGILMNGKLQWKQDMVFLPKTYLMPLDMFTYLPVASSKYTYAIHWCNGGWREEKSTPEQVKKNRKLWELFNSRGK